uniref:Ubiquitin-like domain-containing protein n=1 Tax=Oryza rufipogon TaxID=4529 RepID=A0A0E0NSQ6_ORYRU
MAGIHPRDQRFVFNARQLDDNQSLADCNITHNSTIHFVFGIPCFYATPAYEQFNRLPRELGFEFDEQRRQEQRSKGDIAPANVKTVHCPDCQVQANVYYCNTKEDNEGCVFYRCPYFSAGGCQFVQCADTVDEGLQKRVEHATQETSCPQGNNMSLMEERLQRILDHMKWMEQFLIVCIIALAYVVFVK